MNTLIISKDQVIEALEEFGFVSNTLSNGDIYLEKEEIVFKIHHGVLGYTVYDLIGAVISIYSDFYWKKGFADCEEKIGKELRRLMRMDDNSVIKKDDLKNVKVVIDEPKKEDKLPIIGKRNKNGKF
jgi:hypothetical protein